MAAMVPKAMNFNKNKQFVNTDSDREPQTNNLAINLTSTEGFEPPTPRTGTWCSIH